MPLVAKYDYLDQDIKLVQGTAFAVVGQPREYPGRLTDPVISVLGRQFRGWVRDLASGQVYELQVIVNEDDNTVGFYFEDTSAWAERDHLWHGEVDTSVGWRACAGGSVQVVRLGR